MVELTTQDLRLTRKNIIEPRIRIDIYTSDNKYLDTIQGGLIDGNMSIAADSDVRRTFTANFNPNRQFNVKIVEGNYLWMDKYVLLYIGFHNTVKHEDVWYAQGKYVFTDSSITYDATNNQVSVNASDLVAKLNDTVNGALGQQIISYPAYEQVFLNKSGNKYANNCYSLTISDYKPLNNIYQNRDQFAIVVPANNADAPLVQINGLEKIPIYIKDTNTPLPANMLEFGKIYRFLIKQIYDNELQKNTYRAELVESDWKPYELRSMNEKGVYYMKYIKHNLIRDAVKTTVTQLGRVNPNHVFIDDIGEYKGISTKNKDWENYRKESPLWDTIPYDLEFSTGCSVWSIMQELIGLYPDYEAYFDENGQFHVDMVPDCEYDDTYFENGFLNEVLISENTSIDFTSVRNITEVWGEMVGDMEFFAQTGVSYANNTYTATITGYNEKYYNGDMFALKIPSANIEDGCKININKFGNVVVYDENTEKPLPANKMKANITYVFKIKKVYNLNTQSEETKCYLLCQFQPHAMCVLTDGTVGDDYMTTSGKIVKRYSKEFFQEVYNCENIGFTVIPDSPFTVQKLGERLAVFNGGEFDNIQSDSLAMARAEWELYKSARLTDNINITVKYMPYIDVNIKVQYQGYNDDVPHKYIIKSVSHDFQNGTTSLTLMRWYPLYLPESYPDLIE